MKVAMLIHSYLPVVGGAERQLGALAPLLQARGVEVVVLTRRHRGLAPLEILDGVRVHRLPIPPPKPLASIAFTVSALALLRRLEPDVIHTHGVFATGTTALAGKRLFGTPVAAKLLRGTDEHGDLGRLRRKLGGRRRLAALRQHVDAFIAISRQIDDELAEIGVAPERRHFIPNGVDTERFLPADGDTRQALRRELDLPAGLVTVFTGRLAPEKRLEQLIGLWPGIRRAHPDAWLVLVGTGPDEEKLRRKAGDGVRFTGSVEDVAPYLRAADLFVLPSAAEGLSNALLEALAAGLPAIASSVGGNTDLIDHGEDGWLVDPDDPSALGEAFLELLGDAALRRRFSEGSRRRVVADYALSSTVRGLRALYHQLAAGRPAAAGTGR